MGMISTVTIGADTFSVYALTAIPVDDATTFHNGMLGANAVAWLAATLDNRAKSLVMAADWIDRALGRVFTGTKTVAAQPREWPRDGATCDGVAIPDGTVPDRIATAEFWLGGALLVDAAQAAGSGTGSNIKMVKAGPAEVQFFSPTLGGPSDMRLPQTAWDYLRCYLASTLAGLGGFSSGVTHDSWFSPCDWRRSGGF